MKRRTTEEIVADLQAKIADVQARAARKVARQDPAVRHTAGAVKLLDKALNATTDGVARKTIEEARQSLGAYISTHGWKVPVAGATTVAAEKPKGGRRKAAVA